MGATDILAVLRKRWRGIVAAGLLALAVAAVLTMFSPRQYTTSATVFLAVQGSSVSEQVQGSTYAEKQVQSYADLASSPFVLDRVIGELGLTESSADLARRITTSVPTRTVLIQITVTDVHPQRSADIANATSRHLSAAVEDLSPETEDGTESVRATTIAPASAPATPSAPNVPRNLVVGLSLGLMIGAGVAVLISLLDQRIHSVSDIERMVDNSVVGNIPRESPRASADTNAALRAEAYRRLRTNLQFLQLTNGARTLVVTSSIPGEGKTTTSVELARTLAETGRSVLLVDADLRRPNIAKVLHLEGRVGLTTVLIGRADLQDVTQPMAGGRLHVLPSGRIPPNPSELLGSDAMQALLEEAALRYDHVIVDTPPLLPVTDACVLSGRGADTVVVAGVHEVKRHQLRGAIASLRKVDANIVGLIANKGAPASSSAYEYEYGSRDELDADEARQAVPPRSEPAPRRSMAS
ncbi:polysaccharide biosynthesis tyrosine autokinase [Microlunatus sp. Y2014]|uniref:polysaccharide biosynthesis tyrosine autokinase n=1 Tax=Microlunatus sp. Y2014 TaxID=3418488 RepID=UPI003DA73C06